MTSTATTTHTPQEAPIGPFLVSAYADRTPQPGDRRTLTRAWFVTPKDEYGLTRHCGAVAHRRTDDDDDGPVEPDWYCQGVPVLQIEQVTEEWQGRAAAGVWLPTSRSSGTTTLCERHARILLGDAKYDALPWPGGQVTFTPAPATRAPTTKGTSHGRTR